SLGIGQNVTFSYTTQDCDYSALPAENVCWLVTAGPNAGTHGVTTASDSGGNGTYTYSSATAGTDNLSFWLQSQAACGAAAPGGNVRVTMSSVIWVIAVSSGGPVTEVYFDGQLSCQARYGGDTAGEFYGSQYTATSACRP